MWTSLGASAAAVALLFGVGPTWGMGLAFLILAVCFATFCLLYDEPVRRARSRIARQLSGISSTGVNAEEHHRIRSMAVKPTSDDRKMEMSPMMIVHLASGAAGAGLAVWGLVLRLS